MTETDDDADDFDWYDSYTSGPLYEPYEPLMQYYDKGSRPVSFKAYVMLHLDPTYSVVAHTFIRRFLVSTVWLGVDHNYSRHGPPVIFETLIFQRRHGPTDYGRRASTEKEARKMHYDVCRMVHSGWRG